MANPYLTRPKAVSPHAELEATLSQLRNRRREPQVVAMANQACYAGVVLKTAAPKPIAAAAKPAPATSRPAPAPLAPASRPAPAPATITAAQFAKPEIRMARREWDKLTPTDKSRFFQTGGKLAIA
jgi:hypothetical protein